MPATDGKPILDLLQELLGELWASDEASALTNRAAREIERLHARLKLAEAVCVALSLEPPLKLTGKRREAYLSWKEKQYDR